jgi:hypothetical protein
MITSTPCSIDCPQTCGNSICGAVATVTAEGAHKFVSECIKGHKCRFDDRFAAVAVPKGN